MSVSRAGRVCDSPTLFMHATGLPIEVRLTVFSTGADRLEVLTAVTTNALIEFGHMSLIYTNILMSMCHS